MLQTVSLEELGARIRAARLAAGLTQTALGGAEATVSYVSRIESGHRRPDARVLEAFASRLGITAEELLAEPVTESERAARLATDFVELSLELGDAGEALDQADALVAEPTTPGYLRERILYLRGRALEALGRLDEAADTLEQLHATYPDGGFALPGAMALSRCYRELGDLGRAIASGEAALASYAERGLAGGDEAVQLTVTVAAAYYERGDVAYAVRLCRDAVAVAEESGSPRSRAAAYWNAAIMEVDRGAIDAAVTMASKALALLGEDYDARSLARLRVELGTMQLQLDPPELEEAVANLLAAREQLSHSSASQVDRLRNEAALADAALLGGDPAAARELAAAVFEEAREVSPLVAAEARCVEGQAVAAQGDTPGAVERFRDAVHILVGVGADRSAGNLWMELGALLEEAGEIDAARQAYRSAAAAAGLRARARARTSSPVGVPSSGG